MTHSLHACASHVPPHTRRAHQRNRRRVTYLQAESIRTSVKQMGQFLKQIPSSWPHTPGSPPPLVDGSLDPDALTLCGAGREALFVDATPCCNDKHRPLHPSTATRSPRPDSQQQFHHVSCLTVSKQSHESHSLCTNRAAHVCVPKQLLFRWHCACQQRTSVKTRCTSGAVSIPLQFRNPLKPRVGSTSPKPALFCRQTKDPPPPNFFF